MGGGGGQPLLALAGTRGVTGEKGTMSKMSVDCGLMEMLPAWTQTRTGEAGGAEPAHGAHRRSGKTKQRERGKVFTRGRGTMKPSAALGGGGAALAGGGVSNPEDRLESGELMGVRVTEEISRQESDVTLRHQKREDGLCSRYASSAASMCSGWGGEMAEP